MATSPNFNWPEPDNTDLVKNGALAIRTAVDAIDSSLVDLKGGTTGQVLAKASNTDMDFVWSADSAGMTNPMTTTGDTIYSSSGSTPARLGIGSTGQVLTVAAGIPSWATPATGTPTAVGCYVYKGGTNQSISNTTVTSVTFQAEQFDTNSLHDNTTNNSRITIPTGYAGKYQINASVNFAGNATGDREIYIYRNNTDYYTYIVTKGTSTLNNLQSSIIVNLAAGDYLEIKVWQDSGGALNLLSDFNCNFSVGYLGA